MRTLVLSVLVLPAIPLALLFGELIYPDVGWELKTRIYLISFIVSYPPFYLMAFLARRKPQAAAAVALFSIFVRIFMLFFLTLLLQNERTDQFRAGLLLYLIAIGNYLFFEIITLVVTGLLPASLSVFPMVKRKEKE